MKAIVAIGSMAVVSCVNLQREPLLSWSPTKKPSPHPIDYFVPHFGADESIKTSFSNMANAEGTLGKWTPKQDKKDDSSVWEDHWLLPGPDKNFQLTPNDAHYERVVYNMYPNCYENASGCL
mgnify:CR=1 FL=1|tara:strand:- start:141 stop:506 length:366 start_codon:yes stop_codon:yes gene_type:complete